MYRRLTRLCGALLLSACATAAPAQYPAEWDLGASVAEALRQAPRLQATAAEISAREHVLEQADNWPNPQVEIAIDDSVSLEQNSSGYAISELAITQAIPVGRLEARGKQAKLEIDVARAQQGYQLLEIEKTIAGAFYTLQYQAALLEVAGQRHDSLERLLVPGDDPLVRFFSESERKRLKILQEQAHQGIAAAEGEYHEALSEFKTLLALPDDMLPQAVPIQSVPRPRELDALLESLDAHPRLRSLRLQQAAAAAGIDISENERRVEPELRLFSTRDVFAGREQTSTGIAVMFEIPLWQDGGQQVARARADHRQVQAELNAQQRELKSMLRKSHLHLNHLIEQAQHYRELILEPAGEILHLQRRGYRSGEIDLLNFIDAHETYYEARTKYLMLLYDGWLETTELHYSAGLVHSEVTP